MRLACPVAAALALLLEAPTPQADEPKKAAEPFAFADFSWVPGIDRRFGRPGGSLPRERSEE